ncbi:undecaprenyl-diphosphate phosphatase [Prosthecomicrobium sp. N25]|uniref:undecaprenyl-diphosphate phosphatase n=1 Tax=Prosthecomicrobium sp. N25 TaxID=3129254 RepID=UPI00307792AC
MNIDRVVEALVFGAVEGLTEFLPVSSTGHLLLLGHFLGVDGEGASWKTFVVLIQLGAILAILLVYFRKLLAIALALPSDPGARRFVIGILLAFLPAAVIGAGLHGFIKTILFESPTTICIALIVGGIILLLIDRMHLKPRYTDVMSYPLGLSFRIGLCQCLALIPGVSRSGSTIAGALLMGTDKRSAAEFSFFLAMPTMVGAFTYDLYKNRATLDLGEVQFIALGFAAAFVAGLIVVKLFLDIVSRHGFAPFAWWRIVVGALGLVMIAFVPPGHLTTKQAGLAAPVAAERSALP